MPAQVLGSGQRVGPSARKRAASAPWSLTTMVCAPRALDRILVLRQPWLGLLLDGSKTMEIRCAPYKPGRYWLGHKGIVFGLAVLGSAVRIQSVQQWEALRSQHRVDSPLLPYKKTFALPVLSVTHTRRVPYYHPRGAVGIVRYRRI